MGQSAAENSQNVTNEPNFDEEVLIEEVQETVGVEAKFQRNSGLDKVCPLPSGDAARSSNGDRSEPGEAREKAGIADSRSGASNHQSQASKLKPHVQTQKPRASIFGRSAGRRGRAGSRVAPGKKKLGPETEQIKQKRELRELKHEYEAKLKAGHPFTRDMILDFVDSTVRIAKIPLPPLPRSP